MSEYKPPRWTGGAYIDRVIDLLERRKWLWLFIDWAIVMLAMAAMILPLELFLLLRGH